MSRSASAFSSAFGQTLMQGMELQRKVKQQSDELDIRKKLADSQKALHDAQIAEAEMKLKGQADFLAKVGRGGTPDTQVPDGMGGGTVQGSPGGPTPQDLMAYLASQGNSTALAGIAAPKEKYSGTAGGVLNTTTGQIQPYPPQPLHPIVEQALGGLGPGQAQPATAGPAPQAAPSGQSAPTGGVQPGGEATLPPTQVQGFRNQYGAPDIGFNAKGQPTIQFKTDKNTVHIKPEPQPDGSAVNVGYVFDPQGNFLGKQQLGPELPPAEIQAAQYAATGMRYKPGTPEHAAAAQQIIAIKGLPPQAQQYALAELERRAPGGGGATPAPAPRGGGAAPAQVPRGGGAGVSSGPAGPTQGGGLIGGAIQAGQQQEVQQKAAETAATTRAKVENEPLTGQPAEKVSAYQQLQRGLAQIGATFKPEYVGKPFISGVQADFASSEAKAKRGAYDGAFGGALRQATGDITPEEVTFRQAVTNTANQILYLYSGKQINEAEYQRLKAGLFGLWDQPGVFKTRFENVQREVSNAIADIYKNAYTSVGAGARQTEAQRMPLLSPKATETRPELPPRPKVLRIIPVGP